MCINHVESGDNEKTVGAEISTFLSPESVPVLAEGSQRLLTADDDHSCRLRLQMLSAERSGDSQKKSELIDMDATGIGIRDMTMGNVSHVRRIFHFSY